MTSGSTASPDRASPPAPGVFRFDGYRIDRAVGSVECVYAFEGGPRFTERFEFGQTLPALDPATDAAFERAVQALFVAAGVSYYKLFAPPSLDLAGLPLSRDQVAFFTTLYIEGLAEFAHRNALDIRALVHFANAGPATEPVSDHAPLAGVSPSRSAVLLGGGKDSLVSAEAMIAAGEDFAFLSVNPRQPMEACAAIAQRPLIGIRRQLDPALFDWNGRPGTYNGHVPITAIVGFAAIVGAFFHGYGNVVLSNERSADEPTLIDSRDNAVNHQFSKSSAFEQAIQRYVQRHIHPGIAFFSLLRPLSELHIAQLFARTGRYDHAFTSCNKAFRLNNRPDTLWCGDCAKCRFTFLIMALWMERDRLLSIFPGNLLDDPGQLQGYLDLSGLGQHKPWDCVGEARESATALALLSRREEWRDAAVVRAVAPLLEGFVAEAERTMAGYLAPDAAAFPEGRFRGVLERFADVA